MNRMPSSAIITHQQFSSYYPRLYHMAEFGTWEGIKANGLLSTTALLDLFEIQGERRRQIERVRRPESVTIEHPLHGTAVIRDQKPMRDSALSKCLHGMRPADWYKLLNSRVFFWVTPERVQTLLNARAYRARKHTVITVDTATLFEKYFRQVLLSPINSGSTIYRPVDRGSGTFKTLDQYPFEERRRLRGVNNAVAELCVEYAVPDIGALAIEAEIRQGNEVLEVLYSRRIGKQSSSVSGVRGKEVSNS
jgi:hypothetical protein